MSTFPPQDMFLNESASVWQHATNRARVAKGNELIWSDQGQHVETTVWCHIGISLLFGFRAVPASGPQFAVSDESSCFFYAHVMIWSVDVYWAQVLQVQHVEWFQCTVRFCCQEHQSIKFYLYSPYPQFTICIIRLNKVKYIFCP